ncbi:MAG: ribosome small subunit-dependent GTPase A [Pseudorhodobacter sp.]|nr:ribosome small subunit-dependent GTPase A [Pseudorhodobacter sp.]
MTEAAALAAMGWSAFFADQLDAAERADLQPLRVALVQRARLTANSTAGPVRLSLPGALKTSDFAVGDWVLADPQSHLLHRRLHRKTVIERQFDDDAPAQLIAANIDTLFIVTSCNSEFNPARLERYLALAIEAETEPVVVLTKADTSADAGAFTAQARTLHRGLAVVALNATSPEAAASLAPWCGVGQTVALIGSSGVGKSTLLNTLAGPDQAASQNTGAIRAGDAKGRHTTTARSLHPIASGGWVIDTPGMRSLQVCAAAAGLATLFAEITELAPQCRFRNCTHAHEPGCAVRAAVAVGALDPARLDRWRKLDAENRANTPVQTGPRGNKSAMRRPGTH